MNAIELFEAAEKYAHLFCTFVPEPQVESEMVAKQQVVEMLKVHFLFPQRPMEDRHMITALAMARLAIKTCIDDIPHETAECQRNFVNLESCFVEASHAVREMLPTMFNEQREILEKHYLSNPLLED